MDNPYPLDPQLAAKVNIQLWIIDEEFSKEGSGFVPLSSRFFKSAIEVSKRLQIDHLGMMSHVGNWYSTIYGNRMVEKETHRQTVVLFRNLPYRVVFPYIFGQATVHPLDWVEDTTPELFDLAGEQEKQRLCDEIMQSYYSYEECHSVYIEVVPVIATAISSLMQIGPTSNGVARFCAAQAVEEAFNAYLFHRLKEDPTLKLKSVGDHKLNEFLKKAIEIGFPPELIDPKELQQVQAHPGMRYSYSSQLELKRTQLQTEKNTVAAIRKAIKICGQIGSQISKHQS